MGRLRIAGLVPVLALMLIFGLGTALAQTGTTYTVSPGDTLASIAAEHGTSALELAQLNGITDPDTIWVGQELTLPGSGAPAPVAAVQPTSVPTSVVPSAPAGAAAAVPLPTRTSVPVVQPSPTATFPTAQPLSSTRQITATSTSTRTYVVQPGELLRDIAPRFGSSAVVIARVNGLDSPDLIYPGMKLIIPSTEPPVYTGVGSEDATRFIASMSRQHCWLYLDNRLAGNWNCSTGRDTFPSTRGAYRIQSKMDAAYGATWDFWMPYWLGLYDAGSTENGIHGLPYDPTTGARTWAGMVGIPVTYGCIMLDDVHMKLLFDVAYLGMRVIILP